ncbi:MAG: hypothetical protein IT384_02195 [Deltaproteobacteria bacterium]|nr:hypothetical protein [Deltaproteobacteria bacterium]
MRIVPITVLGLLGLTSCSGDFEALLADLPEEVAWVALLSTRDDGGEAGTTLTPRVEGHFLARTVPISDGAPLTLLGYRDEPIRAALPEDRARLETETVHRAKPGEARLPGLAWVGRGRWGAGRVEASDERPETSVGWLGACPEIATTTRAFAAVSCLPAPCSTSVVQLGCDVVIELGGFCQQPRLSGRLDGQGHLLLDDTPQLGACTPRDAPTPGTRATVDCTSAGGASCRLDIVPPRRTGLRLQAVTLEDASGVSAPLGHLFDGGVLADLALLSDRALVSTYGGAVGGFDCYPGTPGRIARVDLESMAVTTAPAPSCTTHLLPEPLGDGFLALTSSDGPALQRFDRDGRLRDRLSLPVLRDPVRVPADLVRVGGTSHVAALYAPRGLGDVAPGIYAHVLVIDVEAMNVVRTFEVSPDTVRMAEVADGFFVVDGDQSIGRYHAGSGEFVFVRPLRLTCGHLDATAALHVPESDDMVISSRGDTAGLAMLNLATGTCDVLNFFEWVAHPMAATLAAGGERLLVAFDSAGIEGDGAGPSVVAEVDIARRLILPGALTVGERPVHELLMDPQGRAWGILPAEGRLIRIDPR